MLDDRQLGASFRDPSGFLFSRNGIIYRQVNENYRENYSHLMNSGLYDSLVKAGLLVRHVESEEAPFNEAPAYKIIRPDQIPFISYPYEWCFSQLKDAALATLEVQKQALSFGMSLKDSSAYNIQFPAGKPVLIDTLSFEIYEEGKPWVAYRQFCQHFLAPLALAAHRDVRLTQMLRNYIDGIPLDLARKLLPWRTRLIPSLGLHIHLHASAQRRYAGKNVAVKSASRQMSKNGMLGLIDSLMTGVRNLKWEPKDTEWGDYYQKSEHYSQDAIEHKKQIINQYLDHARPSSVWDLGANEGLFSRLASDRHIPTISFDIDPAAVEKNHRACKTKSEAYLLPLVIDLTNPSPDLGWANNERMSLIRRGPTDMVIALALIHHLAISNNVPLPRLASFLQKLGRWLIIEFVPKDDSQVQLLLSSRDDIFPNYRQDKFEHIFSEVYTIREVTPIEDLPRTLYLMERRE